MNKLSYGYWIAILFVIRSLMHILQLPDAHDLFGLVVTSLVFVLIWRHVNNEALLRPFLLGVSIYWVGNFLDWIDGVYKGKGTMGLIADTYDDLFFATGFFLIGIAFLRVISERIELITQLNAEISTSKQLQASLYLQAYSDELTGLGNRRALFNRLNQKLSTQESGTLLYIDVNNFKPVNDQFGHDMGDLVLKLCAKQLHHDGAEAFRMGGDEFVVLLAQQNPARWIEKLSADAQGLKQEYGISFSIGVAPFSADQPTTSDELLANADQAMYSDKIERRNRSR
ncbi:GGDEF domain-containing protein [Chitinibacter bivalviorum]|uniref:GGDEF domain-containing protein n=1 Tax=Chitinibacter bivalviorum TaxID=2739434 RepID=A0A7H9BHI0_9NEIS|nr:GGDEF domain-containing protein [Chitinibacter bivalviorum]QLG86994.1 GGDEF domain-containing protein [Chitinibacter bivalviorum]